MSARTGPVRAARRAEPFASPRPPGGQVDALMLSGLLEIGIGALAGWPYAVAVTDPDRARALGIRSTARLRQLHLDLIALGALSVLASTALPSLPRRVAIPLAVGSWTNALSFAPLVLKPRVASSRSFHALVRASFVTTSVAVVALAAEGARRYASR